MILEHAKRIAEDLVSQLKPRCVRVDVAGSVRREKPEVGDIEICCIPNMIEQPSSFFDSEMVSEPEFVKVISQFDKIKGDPGGRYMQRQHPEGIKLDIFMPQECDYYRQLAIRTGPRKYSWQVLASTWSAMGWCGTKYGLRKKVECYKLNSGRWSIKATDPTLPPTWKSEKDFFEWLGLDYVEPKDRNIV